VTQGRQRLAGTNLLSILRDYCEKNTKRETVGGALHSTFVLARVSTPMASFLFRPSRPRKRGSAPWYHFSLFESVPDWESYCQFETVVNACPPAPT